MTDGWDPDGSPRLFCSGLGGSGPQAMVADGFLGFPYNNFAEPLIPAYPQVTIGTSDFSLELWYIRKSLFSLSSMDEQHYTALGKPGEALLRPYAWVRYANSSAGITLGFDNDPLAGGNIGVSATPSTGVWHHVVGNYDRDGNMQLFVDRVSQGTASIAAHSAVSLPATDIYALASDIQGSINDPTLPIDIGTGGSVFPVILGPIAMHNRLLTPAEIESSYDSRTVQNLGLAVTYFAWFWNNMEGQTDWDLERDRMMSQHWYGLQFPGGAPLGVRATVMIRDVSGNNRHWTFYTNTSYEADTLWAFADYNNHYPIAFASAGFVGGG